MSNKIHSVRYNFLMNFFLTASQFLFPLITFPYISRVLQAAGTGRISFVSSVANYFLMLASLGIPTYGVRACAQVRNDRDQLSKTAQEILFINFVATTLVMVTYFACLLFVPKFQEERTLFYINAVNIVLNMFGMNWLYQAMEQYDYITFRSLFFKVMSVGLMFLLVHTQEDYAVYAAIAVFAAVGSNILNFARAHQFIHFKWYGCYEIKKHLKPILVLFAQSMAVSIYTNLDTVMLGFIKTDVDVGYYNAAVKVKSILLSLVTALENVLLPRMSYYAKHNMVEDFRKTMIKALNFTVMLSVPLGFYFVLFARDSIQFLAGDGYNGAVLAMQIITIAVIPIGLTGVLGIQVLTAIEKEKYVLLSVIAGAFVDFILNIKFIPAYGAAGAALATTIAEFIVLLIQIYYTKDLLNSNRKAFRMHIYVMLSIVSAAASAWTKVLDVKSTFFVLLLSSVLFFGVYGLGLIVTKEPIAIDTVEIAKRKYFK